MKNDKLSKNELEAALCDVRKAHRLLYQYQKRVLDLVLYVREKFNLPEFAGVRRFCSPIGSRSGLKTEYDEKLLRLPKNMWAWDFLYSYQFEFYLGLRDIEKKQISVSIIEVSDSGYYESQQPNKTKTNISSFKNAESSCTCLIFACETINNKKKDNYSWDILESTDILLSGQDEYLKKTKDDNYFIAKKFDLSEFSNQESTDNVLEEFSKFVESKTGVRLLGNK
jgi:hypothetical protein